MIDKEAQEIMAEVILERLELLGYHKLPDKESIRIKIIQMFWGDVSIPDFIEWLYGGDK